MTSKLLMQDAEMIRVFREFGFKPVQIAREYQVSPDTVRNICNEKSFTGRDGRNTDNRKFRDRTRFRKLSDEQVRQIRVWASAGHGEDKIAKLLGGVVARGTVRQVVAGKTYRDVK